MALPKSDSNIERDHSDSASADSELSSEEGWEDVEPEGDDSQPVVGFFTDKIYPDVRSMLKDTLDKFGFDFQGIRKELGV